MHLLPNCSLLYCFEPASGEGISRRCCLRAPRQMPQAQLQRQRGPCIRWLSRARSCAPRLSGKALPPLRGATREVDERNRDGSHDDSSRQSHSGLRNLQRARPGTRRQAPRRAWPPAPWPQPLRRRKTIETRQRPPTEVECLLSDRRSRGRRPPRASQWPANAIS